MDNQFLITRTDDAKDLPLPQYMTEGSAGLDLYANVSEPLTIRPGGIALIKTGICVSLPNDCEAQIRPRSGLAIKHGITLLNSPGTIDADYRGEIKVIVINHGKSDFRVERGLRIAQMVICKIYKPIITEASSLDETKRGDGGFGHTGC